MPKPKPTDHPAAAQPEPRREQPHWRRAIGIRFLPEVADQLQQVSEATGLSTREIVETCVIAHLPTLIREQTAKQTAALAKLKKTLG